MIAMSTRMSWSLPLWRRRVGKLSADPTLARGRRMLVDVEEELMQGTDASSLFCSGVCAAAPMDIQSVTGVSDD